MFNERKIVRKERGVKDFTLVFNSGGRSNQDSSNVNIVETYFVLVNQIILFFFSDNLLVIQACMSLIQADKELVGKGQFC